MGRAGATRGVSARVCTRPVSRDRCPDWVGPAEGRGAWCGALDGHTVHLRFGTRLWVAYGPGQTMFVAYGTGAVVLRGRPWDTPPSCPPRTTVVITDWLTIGTGISPWWGLIVAGVAVVAPPHRPLAHPARGVVAHGWARALSAVCSMTALHAPPPCRPFEPSSLTHGILWLHGRFPI